MIDTHAHLNFDGLVEDIEAVLKRAAEVGVKQIINPASDYTSITSAHDISRKYSGVWAMVGIHPDHAPEISPEQRGTMRGMKNEKTVAIGEIGLDYFRLDEANAKYLKSEQQDLFRFMLGLAKDAGLPVVIHTREAFADTMEILEESRIEKVVIHCFTGTQEEARQALDSGYYLSFTGMITYPKNDYLREIAQWAPYDRIMVETDAPFLPPQPWRGKVCEPAYVIETARCIAGLKNMPLEEFDAITTKTAREFFRLSEETIKSP